MGVLLCSYGRLLGDESAWARIELLGLRKHGTKGEFLIRSAIELGEEIRRDRDRIRSCLGVKELLLCPPCVDGPCSQDQIEVAGVKVRRAASG